MKIGPNSRFKTVLFGLMFLMHFSVLWPFFWSSGFLFIRSSGFLFIRSSGFGLLDQLGQDLVRNIKGYQKMAEKQDVLFFAIKNCRLRQFDKGELETFCISLTQSKFNIKFTMFWWGRRSSVVSTLAFESKCVVYRPAKGCFACCLLVHFVDLRSNFAHSSRWSHMLYILTSIWVLHSPYAGQNLRVFSFFAISLLFPH